MAEIWMPRHDMDIHSEPGYPLKNEELPLPFNHLDRITDVSTLNPEEPEKSKEGLSEGVLNSHQTCI